MKQFNLLQRYPIKTTRRPTVEEHKMITDFFARNNLKENGGYVLGFLVGIAMIGGGSFWGYNIILEMDGFQFWAIFNFIPVILLFLMGILACYSILLTPNLKKELNASLEEKTYKVAELTLYYPMRKRRPGKDNIDYDYYANFKDEKGNLITEKELFSNSSLIRWMCLNKVPEAKIWAIFFGNKTYFYMVSDANLRNI